MTHHTMICRLGAGDTARVRARRTGSVVTELSFVDGDHRLGYGLGQALDQLEELGIRPSEAAIELALLAAVVTAADTRISREGEAQDSWSREVDLLIPVLDPHLWESVAPLVATTLTFLTGDYWTLSFRKRIASIPNLGRQPDKLRTVNAPSVCLFSGGLDSFIGAIDLLASGKPQVFVSHYWDPLTSKHQTYCAEMLRRRYHKTPFHHIRARVGFPSGAVANTQSENTLRGRSFLFFALAAMAADAIGGQVTVHVPENGLISLNVPLDPLRVGSLSTRTTHPYYMARVNELLKALGLKAVLSNAYRHKTKGAMVRECVDASFLKAQARNTMSCSSPAKTRFAHDAAKRKPKHCGHCVPCLIRRAAIVGAWSKDDTEYQIPDLAAMHLDTTKAEGRDVRSFQLAISRLEANPARARFDVHIPGPLVDHPTTDLAGYEKVYVDGMREVGLLLKNVVAKPQ
jgi:7-cyano-7-deazaguanine synthase in queuosine biosynthesis